MKKAVIIGATSGLGHEVATRFLSKGWKLGLAGRNQAKLDDFLEKYGPERVVIQALDVRLDSSIDDLRNLVERLGGMDCFMNFAGVGWQNREVDPVIEQKIASINVLGFYRMIDFAFNYFKDACNEGLFDNKHKAQIVNVSSLAGTRGIAISPSYSSTKKMQASYLEALSQLVKMQGLAIDFTDIRPGFVATPILGYEYPMIMPVEKAGKLMVRAIEKHKQVYIFDWRYRIVAFFWNLIPRWLWVRMHFVYGKNTSKVRPGKRQD